MPTSYLSSHVRWMIPMAVLLLLLISLLVKPSLIYGFRNGVHGLNGIGLHSLIIVPSNELAPDLSFSVSFDEDVAMRIATGARYGLGSDANEEWEKILPRDGHLVHIASDSSSAPEPYTVTLFHQLKCLQIIRQQYISPPSDPISPRTRHCMNYLRQTLYCRLNMGLESVEDAQGRAARDYDAVCKDWSKVYVEAERNQKAFSSYLKEL